MLALVALLLAAAPARPPAAYVDTGTARVPLAITSWCWDTRCGAPLGHTANRVSLARGAAVHLELTLAPVGVTVTIGGAPAHPSLHGREVSFAAGRSGGISAFVRYRRGWVVYTVRLAVR